MKMATEPFNSRNVDLKQLLEEIKTPQHCQALQYRVVAESNAQICITPWSSSFKATSAIRHFTTCIQVSVPTSMVAPNGGVAPNLPVICSNEINCHQHDFAECVKSKLMVDSTEIINVYRSPIAETHWDPLQRHMHVLMDTLQDLDQIRCDAHRRDITSCATRHVSIISQRIKFGFRYKAYPAPCTIKGRSPYRSV